MFWVPPWPIEDDYTFFTNATKNHLIQQANLLVSNDTSVDFILPEQMNELKELLDKKINIIDIPIDFSSRFNISDNDNIYKHFYACPQGDHTILTIKELKKIIPSECDVIMLWENPVPFLKEMFPKAAIIHQMPGFFSRAPYPHTVTFDPVGLYKNSLFHTQAKAIQTGKMLNENDITMAKNFSAEVKNVFHLLQPFKLSNLIKKSDSKKITLLPLQVSNHYAFQADTNYPNQMDFLVDVMDNNYQKDYIVTTQYVSNFIQDNIINDENEYSLKDKYQNLVYSKDFDIIPSISQYLLEQVDAVKCAFSSIGIQGMVWQKPLHVCQDTFLKQYDHSNNVEGLSWEERCNNTISTILSRYQVLASSITKDGHFLKKLLCEIVSRKKSGESNFDLLPKFENIDIEYYNKIMQSFRFNESLNSLNKYNQNVSKISSVLKSFCDHLNDPKIKAVSFDIMDTLLSRIVEKPADVWCFMEKEVLQATDNIAVDFAKIRGMCEVETRSLLTDQDEISLDDIYNTISKYYGMSETQKNKLMNIEIALEKKMMRSRKFGMHLFNIAKNSNKEIYLISDMYLPSTVIKDMLDQEGITDYKELFVSVDYNARKHSGRLYDIVLKNVKLLPQQLLHVGDNKKTDIIEAEAKGIKAFRWSSAIDWLRSNEMYKETFSPRFGAGERARSAIVGTMAREMFDAPLSPKCLNSMTGGLTYKLGYGVLSPVLVGYTMWIYRQAIRDGIKALYFLAREGKIIKEVFNILYPNSEVKTHYLMASRRSVRIACCYDKSDVMNLARAPYETQSSLIFLIEERFGLKISESLIKKLEDSGISNVYDIKLDKNFSSRELFNQAIHAIMSEILENAKIERESYKNYLFKEGFFDFDDYKFAVVDIGWKANIQKSLSDLVGKKPLGYYYATLQDSELLVAQGYEHRAYYGECISPLISPSKLVQNRHFSEYLLCCSDLSFVKFNNDKRVYKEEKNYASRKKFIDEVHHGIRSFSTDFHDAFSTHFDLICIDPTLAERAFERYINHPSYEDASLLVGQVFEDAVGGIEKKYIISPNKKDKAENSIWKPGLKAFYSRTKKICITSHKMNRDFPFIIEDKIIKIFTSTKKYHKFQRNREAFYLDSESKIIRFVYNKLLA
jgi:predicted HAD superfamily hydrolase